MRQSADRALPPRPLRLAGGTVVAIVVAVLIGTLFWTILRAVATQPAGTAHADIGYLIYITTVQATLSTVFSLIAGIALAWALDRLRFPGRRLLIALFAAAIVTPGLVVAFGLLSVWGRSGWFGALNLPIFGLGGVVAAHVILDGAFAARILLTRLDAVPERRLKTGQSLALSPWTRFAVIDWPAMRGTLPGLAAIIFLLAFTSFPIVLLLGGGPSVETLEVAIYAAVRLDFDLGLAVQLALIQIAICAAVILASAALAPVPTSLDQPAAPRWRDSSGTRILQWLVLALAIIGFAAPLLAVLVNGLADIPDVLAHAAFWNAVFTSLGIGAASAALALAVALVVATSVAAASSRVARVAFAAPAYAYLAVPAVTLSLGAFLFVRDLGLAPEAAAPLVVIIANALLALPFATATLAPPLTAIARSRGKLIRSLGLGGVRQFTAIEWPLLARDAGLVLALGFCFSLGDLGVIALFGTQSFTTMPLLMLRALGAYRTHDAAAVAALMLLLTIGAFAALPPLFGRLSVLALDDVRFAYPGTALSYRFSMTAEAGAVTAVRGASGAGKSTLLDLVAGFLAPDSGSIRVAGQDITALPPERRPVSILFQSETLFEHLSAARNVALGLPRPDPARVAVALGEVGLADIGPQRAATLSGGQKQRVALARTLLREKPVLLLDEPFSALDDDTRAATRALVKSLSRKHQWATVLVTHHADDISAIADRVYVLRNGALTTG